MSANNQDAKYPEAGEVWREKATGHNTLIVSKGRERPWPIAWIKIFVTPEGHYWGHESSTERTMRGWFDQFEFVEGLSSAQALTHLEIIERYESDGEDCTELRERAGLPLKSSLKESTNV